MNAVSLAAKPLALTHIVEHPRVGEVLSFPPFVLDLGDERLWSDGRPLRLRKKPFAILTYLARNPGRLVTHDELVTAIWGRVAMSEALLRTHVRDLRRALVHELIETVVGRGYRFIANVARVRPNGEEEFNGSSATSLARSGSCEPLPHYSVRGRAHLEGVRLQLAVLLAVADEWERSVGGCGADVPTSLLEQLAEEAEHLAKGLRAWGQARADSCHEWSSNKADADRRGGAAPSFQTNGSGR
jgi:DNA-binding winged helix-turn-helix (wHTH) protein